jgi:chemotaxis protein CheD
LRYTSKEGILAVNIIVGVSDMKVSDDFESVLVTYSLGSCIGVAIYDKIARVGGLLHFMLPESSLDPEKAKAKPYMFGDTGIPLLFKEAYKLGANKQRMRIVVAGGSQILDQTGFFIIGKRNHMAVRKMFWKNNVMVDFEEVGGSSNRTIKLAVKSGKIWLKTSGVGQREI